ncbi:MAG: NADH:ubiquinone reductase (Na(+)-transporting) subunit B [Bacteroidota bacterium]
MKFLEKAVLKARKPFEPGGKLERYYGVFEAFESFLFVSDEVTKSKGAQIRDGVDMKRFMVTVIYALVPALLFGMYNVGLMYYQATGQEPSSTWAIWWVGIQRVVPIIIISYVAGLVIAEFAFSIIRKHPISEGFLISGILIPLVLPPTIPLWQVAVASIFAVIVAKEAFGGTGMNILNVALVARAFLYFAYPGYMSGDLVWVYLGDHAMVDGFTGATPLAILGATVESGQNAIEALNVNDGMYSLSNMFYGYMPGSVGETSVLWILVGGVILVATGVASWRIVLSAFAGTYLMAGLLYLIDANPYFAIDPVYHIVMGGVAFGIVFMATDPVTAAQTNTGKWIYGTMIGVLTIIIRVLNPAYPEGIMLAILFMNVFAPLIDYYVVGANKKRRLKRATV